MNYQHVNEYRRWSIFMDWVILFHQNSWTMCYPSSAATHRIFVPPPVHAEATRLCSPHVFYGRDLVDTGYQVSVIPASNIDRRSGATTDPRQVANGSSVATCGARNTSLYFGINVYSTKLVRADVRQHNFLVDLKEQRFVEGSTFSPTICSVGIGTDHHPAVLYSASNKVRPIVVEFPNLLHPTFSSSTVPHGVYITTTGPPTPARARRLSPCKFVVAKCEFEEMEQMGSVRRSNSPWSYQLYIVA